MLSIREKSRLGSKNWRLSRIAGLSRSCPSIGHVEHGIKRNVGFEDSFGQDLESRVALP
jgi:hypothetical protein